MKHSKRNKLKAAAQSRKAVSKTVSKAAKLLAKQSKKSRGQLA